MHQFKQLYLLSTSQTVRLTVLSLCQKWPRSYVRLYFSGNRKSSSYARTVLSTFQTRLDESPTRKHKSRPEIYLLCASFFSFFFFAVVFCVGVFYVSFFAFCVDYDVFDVVVVVFVAFSWSYACTNVVVECLKAQIVLGNQVYTTRRGITH